MVTKEMASFKLQAYLYTHSAGEWTLVHNGQDLHTFPVVPGCSSFTLNMPTLSLKQDGYFYIKFTHKEFKPSQRFLPKKREAHQSNMPFGKLGRKLRGKPRRKLRGKQVDYLSLISSPIYYDLFPFNDHWYRSKTPSTDSIKPDFYPTK
jgi:hypothetical protein